MEGAACREPACVVAVHMLAEGSAGGGDQEGATGGGGGVMLHQLTGSCFDPSEAASAPAVGQYLSGEERTRVKDLQGRPPAPAGVAACKEEGRLHQGRPVEYGGVVVAGEAATAPPEEAEEEECCGRERLKRHRAAMAGRVWVPESWGHEKLLKDWSDCAAIDRALVPAGLLSARAALVAEWRRRGNSGGFRFENRCLST